MDYDIAAIVTQDESTTLEFKESYSDDILRTLIAFANGINGEPKGLLLIGINNKKDIISFKGDFDWVQKRVTDLCRNNCDPPLTPKISLQKFLNKQIVVFEIERSNQRPHRYAGICYVRLGSTNRKATSEEEISIHDQSIRKKFDEKEYPDATTEDLDLRLIFDYYRATRSIDVTETDGRSPETILEALELGKKIDGIFRPTVAAILIFGKNPQKFFPLSSVNAIRFRGINLADHQLDRQQIQGTLDVIINYSVNFVRKFSTIGSVISSSSVKRLDINEYPLVAIREAIANAVTHRDYSDRGSQIDLYMFDDRIEIKNPGTLGGGLTIDDLKKQSGKRWLRNPTIAGLLLELKYIEKAGTGIPRIYRSLKDNGSPEPEFFIDNSSVKIVLRAHPDYVARRKFEDGLLAKDRREYETAREFFKDAIRIQPGFFEAINAWATLEGDIGNLEEARSLYRQALEISPTDSIIYLNWALLEDRTGHTTEARKLYEKGLEHDPDNINLLYSWASLEKKLTNYPKSRELYRKATILDPTHSRNWQALGQLEIKCKNYEDAEQFLLKALNSADDDYSKAWIYSDLAYTLSHLRRPDNEIEKYYKTSLNLNPDSVLTNYNYSEFLKKRSRITEAENYRKKASDLGWTPDKRRRRR